jgi:Fe2+ transport system protein B
VTTVNLMDREERSIANETGVVLAAHSMPPFDWLEKRRELSERMQQEERRISELSLIRLSALQKDETGVVYDVVAGRSLVSRLSALGFTPGAPVTIVQMLFIPCVATVGTILHETNSWKWTLVNLTFLLVVSLGVGIVCYQLAALLG